MLTIPYSSSGTATRSKLEDLTDVKVNNLQDEQIIEYDNTESKWVNKNNSGGSSGASNLNNLTDVRIFGIPTNGQVLGFDVDENKWINTNSATPSLDQLVDVNTSGKETNSILTYNGTNWIPGVAYSNGRIRIGQGAGGTNVLGSVAIGIDAGKTNQTQEAIAIGQEAGNKIKKNGLWLLVLTRAKLTKKKEQQQ